MDESSIDPNVFPDDKKVDKADLRTQFQIAHDEISELMKSTALPSRMAFDSNLFDNL